MFFDAATSKVKVLKAGTMETRKNAAATLFRISLADDNNIIISSVMIPALVDLLEHEYPREKRYHSKRLRVRCKRFMMKRGHTKAW